MAEVLKLVKGYDHVLVDAGSEGEREWRERGFAPASEKPAEPEKRPGKPKHEKPASE